MAVDRQKTTPFFVRLFYRTGGFHRMDEFGAAGTKPLPQHLEIYTWTDCTLHELSKLVHQALPTVLPSPAIGTRLAFRSVFPDMRSDRHGDRHTSSLLSGPNSIAGGSYFFKDLGSVVVGEGGLGALGPDSLPEDDNDNDDDDDGHGYSTDDSRSHNRRGRPHRRRSASPARSESRSRSHSRSRSRSPGRRRRSTKSKQQSTSTSAPSKDPPSPTLFEAGFKPGDYISCAVFPPLQNGHVPGPPATMASAGGGGPLSRLGGGGGGGAVGFGAGAAGGEGGGRGRGFGRTSLLNDDWRRGEAPPPPSDGYSRPGIGYGPGSGGGSRRFPPPSHRRRDR